MRTEWYILLGYAIAFIVEKGLLAQPNWVRFRPTYTDKPLLSAEKPRLRDPGAFEVVWKPNPSVRTLREKVLHTFRTASTLPGYRIQVIATPNRSEADSLRLFIMESYPGIGVYRFYEPPLYKLRIGDFLTKKEAEDWLERYGRAFSGAFIVPDKVLKP
ncbi:MAG: SPOR domain-containing protein [Bacteroidia bacterium]|nr:SPOR domain-containing protein [Bacteroidia bacterium]MDW8133595.1 SPOR domain-containing protein [Bacteroidia bacterium]